MSILSSILLIVSGLALIFMILNTRPKARERRLDPGLEEQMRVASEIAVAAGREAFLKHLDFTDDSLALLEQMIHDGWGDSPLIFEQPAFPEVQDIPASVETPQASVEALSIEAMPTPALPAEGSRSIADITSPADASVDKTSQPVATGSLRLDDSLYVISAYVGELLVRNHKGIWVSDKKEHQLPFVYFARTDVSASPFDLVRRKMEAPDWFDLKGSFDRLIEEAERAVAPVENRSAGTQLPDASAETATISSAPPAAPVPSPGSSEAGTSLA